MSSIFDLYSRQVLGFYQNRIPTLAFRQQMRQRLRLFMAMRRRVREQPRVWS